MAAQAVIVDWGVVSPIGTGRAAFAHSLRAGHGAVTLHHVEGLGPIPLASVDPIAEVPGQDRALTFLTHCLEQIRPFLDPLLQQTPPERRAVAAATSKGGMLLYLRDPKAALRDHWDQMTADAPARFLSRTVDARGPLGSYVAACATGLTNLLMAAQWIQDGLCDLALAAASEATLHPLYLASFQNLGAMARTGCYPFDARHEGFVAGEGAALFLLARRNVAEAAGLPPQALITGGALAADACGPVKIDAGGAGIANVGARALQRAGVTLADVDLVNGHGTGTVLNDAAEAAALRRLANPQVLARLPLHALKGATGHLMGAAGAVETAAALEALCGNFAPATLGHDHPAEETRGLCLLPATEPRPLRRVLKWSFGFGGQLAAAVLERPSPSP